MADMSNIQALSLQPNTPQHQVLEEEEEDETISSSQQTLDNSITNCSSLVEEEEEEDDDDDLVNVDEGDVLPYTFNFDPFSPLNSSFFVPSHHHHHNPQVNSNSCSCCSCESGSESESESDCPDSTVYPDCLYGHEEEYDQMDFITDLFDSRGEIEHVSGTDEGISVSEAINDHDDDFVSSNIEELGLGFEGGGLRVVGIESESDSGTDEPGQVNDQNDERIQITDMNHEHFWDCPTFDTARVDDRDGLSSVIDRIEDISVSSDISSEGDSAVGVLEWEILLAVNNLERDLEFETNGDEGFVYTAEFDTLIGQFVETVRALRGSPPAAKSIIDNLPSVVLKTNNSKDGDHDPVHNQDHDHVICAVCKDEISMEEKVTQLPCRHHYHGDCIVPWLSIRNTCPVCRFELPTDDVDYERSKNRVNDNELVVGYGSELSP
ncbi:E3 ubiquitin-protein ligase CIP8-like [Cynara cardunculus var. scolymus]|uniref:RING-type E3 ubiquitin transferase n=1 Tax=Cynara cardunculus var. scolymus TaxID=59895 RepID=A0A103Y4Y8_CYNCS|nr:E3 ubiquitin-protein ligase CIP8-like [Cynara cardunculus var. scolymus]KVI02607.1 Zinc finger, RING/FYVE/PHD-type [Cynara cardunculus var. scolymus]